MADLGVSLDDIIKKNKTTKKPTKKPINNKSTTTKRDGKDTRKDPRKKPTLNKTTNTNRNNTNNNRNNVNFKNGNNNNNQPKNPKIKIVVQNDLKRQPEKKKQDKPENKKRDKPETIKISFVNENANKKQKVDRRSPVRKDRDHSPKPKRERVEDKEFKTLSDRFEEQREKKLDRDGPKKSKSDSGEKRVILNNK
eukprot:TRINITY_DN6222_c0_g1_i1.p1 TRINITY_DN6222_c0_g1~~TRINITY_DN6222_c0_g1_i1.p1  ORF type:complete len:208 (+),score=77.49 TRINITY_DN6222_c0_g1_i1:42-626(+)